MKHTDPRPETVYFEGREWVPKTYADALMEKLREKQRTQASHNHQFAAIHDLWHNLPASHAGAPYAASAEAFRKHGLVETGHCDVETLVFEDAKAARDAAPYIAALARRAHGYALVIARGPLVICTTPHSQSYRAMGKELFERSKADVLEWGMRLLGVSE